MKTIKGMGLSGAMTAAIAYKRDIELKAAMRERYSVLWVFAFGKLCSFIRAIPIPTSLNTR